MQHVGWALHLQAALVTTMSVSFSTEHEHERDICGKGSQLSVLQ